MSSPSASSSSGWSWVHEGTGIRDQSPSIKTETECGEDWQHISDSSLGSESDFTDLESADGREPVASVVADHNEIPLEQFLIRLFRVFEHPSTIYSVDISHNGRYVATGSEHGTRLYDLFTGPRPGDHTMWRLLPERADLLSEQAILANDVAIVGPASSPLSDRDEFTQQVVNLGQVSESESEAKSTSIVYRVRFSPDGRYLATGSQDKQIRVWDVTRRGIQSILKSHNNWVVSLDFYPSANRLVSTSLDRTARIWSTLPSYRAWDIYSDIDHPITLTLNDQLTSTGSQAAWCSAVSYDGLLVAVGSEDGCISFCNAVTGRLVERVTRAHADWISGIVFLGDGTGVVSSSFDGTIKIWKWGNDNVTSLVISENGVWIVSGSTDGTVRIWDSRDGRLYQSFHAHDKAIESIALSKAGDLLATASRDKTVRLCETIPVYIFA
ncbi:WD40 repeat-like protein [Stereum hirsutum FP-91666 SS1]|uniref:WD40 repeat-like protein n=1 Tax=Stereum hirsutum (strain FP-91666) TaxID=721885 RepID=UPI000440D2B4|nr:WD40 repeat-like protein [Stereum hirsutum FP-91666 SS1]EIM88740.1 WD40 repeat-like protein [Stereum hirsutum FP-91666 SS1]